MKHVLFALLLIGFYACTDSSSTTSTTTGKTDSTSGDSATAQPAPQPEPADAATMMAKKQVPVLCYHNIQENGKPLRSTQGYDVYEDKFRDQMKALADSGYHTILPEQYYNYLVYGAPLPEKPVMITFDDTDEDQFTIGKKVLDQHGFKGVYFIMTISIGKPRYMSKEQIKQLADEGHAVECHTWDHHRTDRYVAEDWEKQLDKPRKTIEEITGKKVNYFAYPFGVWSPTGFPELEKRGYKMAFQLGMKRDSTEPLLTARRIIVPGWSGERLLKNMTGSFK